MFGKIRLISQAGEAMGGSMDGVDVRVAFRDGAARMHLTVGDHECEGMKIPRNTLDRLIVDLTEAMNDVFESETKKLKERRLKNGWYDS